MGLGAGLDRCGKSRPPSTGIRSPDLPARSESLYRLSYPGSFKFFFMFLNSSMRVTSCANLILRDFQLTSSDQMKSSYHTFSLRGKTLKVSDLGYDGTSALRVCFFFDSYRRIQKKLDPAFVTT